MKKTVLGLLALLAFTGCGIPGYSEGERVGELTKFSKKGMICKSFEGELKIQEGGSGDHDNGRWDFSVRDQGIADFLQANMGKRLKLHYQQLYTHTLCELETTYIVDKVTIQ